MMSKNLFFLLVLVCLTGCSPLLKPVATFPTPTPLTDSYTAARDRLFTQIELMVPGTKHQVLLTKKELSAGFGDQDRKIPGEYGSVTMGDQVVFNNDVGFSTIGVNYDGAGEMFYVAAFEATPTGWRMTDSQELGYSIRVQSLQVEDTKLQVSYVKHGPGQDLADPPNVEVKGSFSYNNQKLTQLE